MRVGELFDTAIEEKIEPVIKVGETGDSRKLAVEIGTYVVTRDIEKYVDDILEVYTDTLLTKTSEIGVWISGYFGSGKSHFAKILSLLAGNPKLEGLTACERFAPRIHSDAPRRASILRSLGRMGDCGTRVLAFNLNTLSDSRTRELPKLLLSQHYQSLGYGGNFIYARVIEAELDRRGKLDELHAAVSRRTGKSWGQVRNNLAFYSKQLFEAASEVANDVFPTPEDVRRALDDAQKGELFNVQFLVGELLDDLKRREAEEKRPQRLMLVLDESGQWIENDGGRLAQLQSFIEESAAAGQGKIWIIVTTHGDMGAIYKEARARQEDFKKIEGRFRFKPALTTENIEQVLEDRLFRKKLSAVSELDAIYRTRGGVLRGIGELANTSQVLPACTVEKFATYYPFFPYQVHLIPEIVKSLRSRGGRGEQMTGSTRTLLAITQDILRAGRRRYLDQAVGALVSFDEVYDNLAGEGEISPDVRTELSRIKSAVGGATDLTQRVAEVLFLIHELSYVPRTKENLGRLLVEDAGEDLSELVARVEPEIERLIGARMVARVGEEYEFLTGERRTFEEEVSQREMDLREQDREKGLADHFVQHGGESHWRAWLGSASVSYLGREFSFRLRVDETAVSGTSGEAALNFVSPLAAMAMGGTALADLESLSLRSDEQNTIYFLSGRVTGFDRSLSRYLAMREVVDGWKVDPRKSEDARRMALECEADGLIKAGKEVQRGLEHGIRSGYVIFRGSSRPLVVKTSARPEDALRAEMATFWPIIYSKFDRVPMRVANDQKAIPEVLAGSTNLSADVRELKLYDKAGKLDPHSPLLDAVRMYLSTEQNAGRRIVGKGLIEKFSAPPYGWDPNAVRVGVAAMVRAGAVKVLIGKKPYTNPADPELVESIRVSRSFDRVELVIEETEVPPEILTETRTFLMQLAKKRGVDETPAALSDMAGGMATAALQKAQTVRTWAGGSGMPLPAAFANGEDAWRSIEELSNPVHRVREIHTRRQELQAGKEAIETYAAFQGKSAGLYSELSALVKDLDSVSYQLDGERGIQGLLEAYHTASSEASFGNPETWRRLQADKARAVLALQGVLELWRAEARHRIEGALSELPLELGRRGLDESLRDALSAGLVALREGIDTAQSASQVAALPGRIDAEVRRVGNLIQAKAAAKVAVPVPGPDPEPPPRPRAVRRLRTRDVALVTSVQTVEEWNELRDRLDARVRGLLAEGYEVELD